MIVVLSTRYGWNKCESVGGGQRQRPAIQINVLQVEGEGNAGLNLRQHWPQLPADVPAKVGAAGPARGEANLKLVCPRIARCDIDIAAAAAVLKTISHGGKRENVQLNVISRRRMVVVVVAGGVGGGHRLRR